MKYLILLSMITSLSYASIKIDDFNLDLTNHKITENSLENFSSEDKVIAIACYVLTERYRYHMYNQIMKDKNCIANPNNTRYISTIYSVILTELVKATLNIQNKYAKYDAGEYKYNPIQCGNDKAINDETKYTQANWNYFFLINAINMIMNTKEDIKNCLDKTYWRLIAPNKQYKDKLDKSKNDIEYYFDKLGLMEYITSARKMRETVLTSSSGVRKFYAERMNEIDNQSRTLYAEEHLTIQLREYIKKLKEDEVFDKTKSKDFEKSLSGYTEDTTTLLKEHYKINEDSFINKKKEVLLNELDKYEGILYDGGIGVNGLRLKKLQEALSKGYVDKEDSQILSFKDRDKQIRTLENAMIMRIICTAGEIYQESFNKDEHIPYGEVSYHQKYVANIDEKIDIKHTIGFGHPMSFKKRFSEQGDEKKLFDEINKWDSTKLKDVNSVLYKIYKLQDD